MWLGMHRIVSLCYDLFFPFQQEKKKKKKKNINFPSFICQKVLRKIDVMHHKMNFTCTENAEVFATAKIMCSPKSYQFLHVVIYKN